MTSEIVDFYNGRSVFITGAAGFLGTVLMESLLRCCPGIENVYILLREKKGVSPEGRKTQILEKKVFSKLLKTNAEVVAKIRVVEGDIVQGDLGIQTDVLQELEKNVSVVFHCAAIINFIRGFREMVTPNVIGTDNVIKFCRRLSNLAAFVHCSTAYSNCNQKHRIEEKIYTLPITARQFIEHAQAGDDERLERLASECQPPWPNNYTFTKSIAEHLISDEASDMPTAIVRPSVVIHNWKGAVPGYIETGGGIVDLSIGIGKGFIRVLYLRKENVVDLIPADVVVNTLITTAWYIGTKSVESPLVVNCVGSHALRFTWGEINDRLYKLSEENPLPKMYQKQYLVVRSNRFTYWASALVNHYGPACFIDCVLLLLGKKPILVNLYRFYDRMASVMTYFIENEWTFDCLNLKRLISAQSSEDSKVFPMDVGKIDKDDLISSLLTGGPFYDWNIDKRSFEDRMSISHKRYMVTTFLKWMTVFGLLILFGVIIMKVLSVAKF